LGGLENNLGTKRTRVLMHMDEQAKTAVDAFAISGTVGALAGWLPPIAALLTLIWTLIRIWETDTVQGLINKKKSNES